MNPVFEALQRRYQDLMARSGTPSPGEEFWESIRLFLEDAQQAGRALTDPGERALLRAYMRFLAVLLHEHGETPPPVELLPPERGRCSARTPGRTGIPGLVLGTGGSRHHGDHRRAGYCTGGRRRLLLSSAHCPTLPTPHRPASNGARDPHADAHSLPIPHPDSSLVSHTLLPSDLQRPDDRSGGTSHGRTGSGRSRV